MRLAAAVSLGNGQGVGHAAQALACAFWIEVQTIGTQLTFDRQMCRSGCAPVGVLSEASRSSSATLRPWLTRPLAQSSREHGTWLFDLRLRSIPEVTRLAMDSTPRVCAFGGTFKRKDCPRCPEFGSSLAVAIIGPALGLENPDKKWRRGWQTGAQAA